MPGRDCESGTLSMFFNTHLSDSTVAVQDGEVLGAIQSRGGFLRYCQGFEENFVTEFSALKSGQNLPFSLPSELFLGTKLAGADHGDLLSYHSFVRHILDLCLQFLPEGVRSTVLRTTNALRVTYRYLIFHNVSALEVIYVFVMKDMHEPSLVRWYSLP